MPLCPDSFCPSKKSFSVHTHIKLIFLSSDGPKKIGRRGVVKEKRSDRLKNSKVESNEKKAVFNRLDNAARPITLRPSGDKIFIGIFNSIA